jgi:hypothetical protein
MGEQGTEEGEEGRDALSLFPFKTLTQPWMRMVSRRYGFIFCDGDTGGFSRQSPPEMICRVIFCALYFSGKYIYNSPFNQEELRWKISKISNPKRMR